MRVGTIVGLPNEYTNYARIKDASGTSYTVDKADLPEDAELGGQYAYKVELWSNDGGVGYGLTEKD